MAAPTFDEDELPQRFGDDPPHQESFVLIYYEDRARIRGFHRIGHEQHWLNGEGKMVALQGACTMFRVPIPSAPPL